MTSITTVDGNTTTLAYSSGKLSTVTDAAGEQLSFGWTGSNVTSITDPAGRTVHYGYTSGDLTQVTDVAGGTWNLAYYSGHLLHTIEDPDQSVSGGDAKTVTNIYDGSGRVTEQTDQDNRSTYLDYTSIPDATKITDPKGNVTVDFYDQDGLMEAETKGYGTTSAQTWHYQYDPVTAGPTLVVDPNGTVMSMTTYDAAGNIASTTDRAGVETTYTYNSLNLPLTATKDAASEFQTPHPDTTTYTYDTSYPSVVDSVSTPVLDTQSGASGRYPGGGATPTPTRHTRRM